MTMLIPKRAEDIQLPVAPSAVFGATAAFTATLLTYPLDLLRTRFASQIIKDQVRGSLVTLMDC